MKKYIFLLLLFPCWILAQNSQIIETSSGEDLSEKISPNLQYLFPEFTNGDVFFRSAQKGSGRLNYNLFVREMQFVNDNQIMALANLDDIAMVNINNRKFYPFNKSEFTEELLSTDKAQLRVRRMSYVASYAKKSAYGTSSSTDAITSYSSIYSGDRLYELSVMGDVIISLRYFYYLVGTNGKYAQIKNVKAFTKQFPTHRAQIETFVKEHNIRFDKEDDLKALLVYCSEL